MASMLASLATGLSTVILVAVAYQLGVAVRKLQDDIDAKAEAEKKPAPGGRVMFSGLYPAKGASEERPVPGLKLIAAAGGLGLISLLLGLVPSSPSVPQTPAELAVLGARVDSLALSFAQRRAADSIAAATPVPASAPVKASRAERPKVVARVTPPVVIPAAVLPDSTPIRIP